MKITLLKNKIFRKQTPELFAHPHREAPRPPQRLPDGSPSACRPMTLATASSLLVPASSFFRRRASSSKVFETPGTADNLGSCHH